MSPGGRRVLFATSNGTGLGHLNRAMAIARRLPSEHEAVFFTLSEAAPVLARAGHRVEYFPSYRRPGSGSDVQWNMRLRRELEAQLDEHRPDLIVFDGVHPYRALTHVLTAAGAPPSIWCRRPLWRAGSATAPLARTGAFDAVLEPGELAGDDDPGPTAARRGEAFGVGPIVYLDPGELIPREQAAAELRLDPARTTALVALGQGGATDTAVARALRRLASEPGLQIAVLQSSVGAHVEVPTGVVRLEATFPMSRYFRAFDLAVAAAGYNAFHELIAFAVPSLLVPMPRNTDDQAVRARWAERSGAARTITGPADDALDAELGQLLDGAVREGIRARCAEVFTGNGAADGAGLVAAMLAGERPAPEVRRRGGLYRWLHHSSHPVGPTLPLAAALTARDLALHPERRRPRAVVVALGVPEGTMAETLAEALQRLGEPSERVLVATDSLEFAALRAAGVALLRVSSPKESGLGDDPRAYRAFFERRLERALPGHERLQRVSIGAGAPAEGGP